MKLSKSIALLACLAFLLGACARTDDVQTLQNRTMSQEQRINSLEQLRKIQADQSLQIDQLQTRMNKLEGRINELHHRLEVKAPEPAYPAGPELPVPGAQPGLQPGATDATGTQTPVTPVTPPVATTPEQAPVDPAQALYDKALKLFNEQNYQAAQATWKEFADKYPQNSLVSNAIFWQGESYYQMRDYPKAILSYNEIIHKYQNSPKYRSAMLKQGISFIIIKRTEAGRVVLNDLIKKYPNTPEAQRAEEFLKNSN